MKIKIDQEEKVVFLSVGYPTCMVVPHLMQKHYPEYSYRIMTHQEFVGLELPLVSHPSINPPSTDQSTINQGSINQE